MFKNVHRNGRIDHANIEAAIHRCPTEYQDPASAILLKQNLSQVLLVDFMTFFRFLLFKEHLKLTASSE